MDLDALTKMEYSGRGIIAGVTPAGNPFLGYSLTGRSTSSQARKLVKEENTQTIRTSVTNLKELEKGNSALLLYDAVTALDKTLVASNGAQTTLIRQAVRSKESLLPMNLLDHAFSKSYDENGIDLTTYEPDSNQTPRISAVMYENKVGMHHVWCEDDRKKQAIYGFFLQAGEGKLITTYQGGNESPKLLPFTSKPLDVTVSHNNIISITEEIYRAISGGSEPGANYRVAAAVMMNEKGNIRTHLINRSERGN